MEQNSKRYNLKELFASLVCEGLHEENKTVIENFLSGIVDTNQGKEVFQSTLFYNFLLLLKAQPTSSFLIQHLIQEVELKSLRYSYMSLVEDEKNSSCNCGNQNNNSNQRSSVSQFNVSPVSKIIDIAEGRGEPENDRRANR